MKKYKLHEIKKLISDLVASTVAVNSLSLSSDMSEESEEQIEISKSFYDSMDYKKQRNMNSVKSKKDEYKEIRINLVQCRNARSSLGKPSYYGNSDVNKSRKR